MTARTCIIPIVCASFEHLSSYVGCSQRNERCCSTESVVCFIHAYSERVKNNSVRYTNRDLVLNTIVWHGQKCCFVQTVCRRTRSPTLSYRINTIFAAFVNRVLVDV